MTPAPTRGVLATSLWLLRSGLTPIPVAAGEKRPIGRGWGRQAPTRESLRAVYASHRGAGVGVALGPMASVVDFEIDDQEAAAPLLERLTLPDTLGWQSRRGNHKLFLWDKRLEGLGSSVAHFSGAELRIGSPDKQLMSITPPSIGDDGRCRQWNNVWQISPLPECLLDQLERKPEPRPQRRIELPTGTSRYADAAFRAEVRAVREAKEGSRNSTLNKAAFCLGQLVGVGMLNRKAVEAALAEAALSNGLAEPEVLATIRSGITAGIAKPRKL